MFSIYENNQKISGACRSFVLCLDNVAISPFIYFNTFYSAGPGLQTCRFFLLTLLNGNCDYDAVFIILLLLRHIE